MSQQPGSPATGPDGIQSILALRRVTRAMEEVLRAQVLEYLATLAPLLRPKAVLGDYVQSGTKELARRADVAFKELQAEYEAIAPGPPFNLPRELKPPIELPSVSLELTALEYQHVAVAHGQQRTITVRSPLTWVLSYSGQALAKFQEALSRKGRTSDDVLPFVLGYLVLNTVVKHQTGVGQLLSALHFPLRSSTTAGLGGLPITTISVPIATVRPSDEMILQSAELTGVDAFEEIVNVEDVGRLSDALKERLVEIVRAQAPELIVRVEG